MRPTTNWGTYGTEGFNPIMSSGDPSRVPVTVNARTSLETYPSGSAINPGYAYGTFIPLFQHGTGLGLKRFAFPYTVPVNPNAINTVPLKYNNTTAWINPQRSLRMKGQTDSIPGNDYSRLDQIQQYLANALG